MTTTKEQILAAIEDRTIAIEYDGWRPHRVIAYQAEPTVIVEDPATGKRESHALSVFANRFEVYTPEAHIVALVDEQMSRHPGFGEVERAAMFDLLRDVQNTRWKEPS